MPLATANWLWIGNRALLDPTPLSSITVAQRNAILGYEANGSTQIQPVAVTGDYVQVGATGTAFQFASVWDATGRNIAPTRFSYATDAGHVTGTTMNSAFGVRMQVQTNSEPDVFRTEPATLVQMSNGDLFFRPNSASVASWSDITRVYSIQVASVDQAIGASYGSISHTTSFRPDIFDIAFPCFAANTLIETATGLRAAGTLRVGDLIRTVDQGLQPILWIGARHLDRIDLTRSPRLRPVRLAVGSLGAGLPARDLIVSPQHRILVRSKIAALMFAAGEVLVAAKHLTKLPGIDTVDNCDEITYVHFMFAQHQIVLAEGAEVESLYAGPEALKMLPAACRTEIVTLLPALAEGQTPSPAKQFVCGRKGRKLVCRHAANARPLVTTPVLRTLDVPTVIRLN